MYLDDPGRIVVPSYRGKRGHPSLFPRHVIEEVFEGVTLRDILNKDPDRVKCIHVNDEGVILDMDTAEDYGEICKKAKLLGGNL